MQEGTAIVVTIEDGQEQLIVTNLVLCWGHRPTEGDYNDEVQQVKKATSDPWTSHHPSLFNFEIGEMQQSPTKHIFLPRDKALTTLFLSYVGNDSWLFFVELSWTELELQPT